MSVFSNIASYLGFGNENAILQEKIPIKEKVSIKSCQIIDPRRISVVKSHSIIGAIENNNVVRYAKLVNWLDLNSKNIAKRVLDDDENLSSHELCLYPNVKGGSIAFGPGCFGNTDYNDNVYVLGDTHGDFQSFIAILDTIIDDSKHHSDSNPIIYLLGDILDRNTDGCMYMATLIMAILQKSLPEEFNEWNAIRLGIVKGDHDVALKYDSIQKKFISEVSPAEFCDWLNNKIKSNGDDEALIGKAWIRLMQECPAAAFLEGSCTLLSHGGIPRSDVQETIKSGIPYIVNLKDMETDFEWCRMVDAKNKLLNRGTKTSEIGFQEFDSFNKLFFNGRVKNFIFGHQHPVSGFQRYDKSFSGYDVLCISSYRKDDSIGGPTIPHFCKITSTDVNVYSMKPAIYVVRLEENSKELKKSSSSSIPTSISSNTEPNLNGSSITYRKWVP